MMKLITAQVKDLSALQDIDLKTYQYPVTDAGWNHALVDAHCVVYMVQIGRKMVGYAMIEPSTSTKGLRVHKCGVLPEFRGLGVGKFLLKAADKLAIDLHIRNLEVVVPEIHCLTGDPDNVSLWLKFQGFKATSVVRDYFTMYGRQYDGFLFERTV